MLLSERDNGEAIDNYLLASFGKVSDIAAAFARWTGQEPDLACMLDALRRELSSRRQP